MNVKELNSPTTTITYDRKKIIDKAENIYEAIVITSKRADQIAVELKKELTQKLDEFAFHNETLDEVFENREQIEVSKFYERLPKPTSIALDELLKDEIYIRRTREEDND